MTRQSPKSTLPEPVTTAEIQKWWREASTTDAAAHPDRPVRTLKDLTLGPIFPRVGDVKQNEGPRPSKTSKK